MSKTIRWGVIGCGSVAEVKSVPAYRLVDGFEVTSIMRRNLDLAEEYAKRHNISHFSNNADDLINNPDIDAIYIATPPDSHHHYALKVAKAGKICCIEKPMAPSYKECVAITNAFRLKNIPLFVAYYRRSLPHFEKVKSLIKTNLIGALRHINWQFHKPANDIDLSKAYNWRTDSKIAYGGYFDDLASHGLDLFVYLLGTVTEASGISTNQQGLYSAMDTISGSWIHTNTVTGSGYWNFGAYERKDQVEILGSKGKIVFSVFGEVPIKVLTGGEEKSILINNPKHIQYFHVDNMRHALFNDIDHPSTGKTATHTAWVMDKILGKNP